MSYAGARLDVLAGPSASKGLSARELTSAPLSHLDTAGSSLSSIFVVERCRCTCNPPAVHRRAGRESILGPNERAGGGRQQRPICFASRLAST